MSNFTSFTTTPTRFNDLIIRQQHQSLSSGAFKDVVEKPKGQICVVRDAHGQFYLWISRGGENEWKHPIRIIAVSTIRFVDAKKVSSSTQSTVRGLVSLTANCQAFPVGECQQDAAFQVKLTLKYYDDFLKIVKDGIQQPSGFHCFASKHGAGAMTTFSPTDQANFRDLIIQKKNVHSGQGAAGKEAFDAVVECPKGQIMLVRDYFGQEYLLISVNNKEQDVECTIPISTIRDIHARRVVTAKAPPTRPPDHQVRRQPLQSQVTRMCRRVEVEFTANCHRPVHAPGSELQHGAVFRVKLPHTDVNKFLKVIGFKNKSITK
jgi:hypothetical protein